MSPSVSPALERLAAFSAQPPAGLDRDARNTVRNAFIDVLGCMRIGAKQAVTKKAIAATRHRTGACPVIGSGETRSPETAAFVNAVSAHAIEFDDWEIPGNTHSSAVVFPALLAACEGRDVSGDQVAMAYAVGFEAIARLGEALNFDHYDGGWHSTGTLGCIGAAAAVANLWQLDAPVTTNALSFAVSRACGFSAQFGSDAKPVQAGFAAESGYTAACLACAGLTAQAGVLEGDKGYAALTAHCDAKRLSAPFDHLGDPFALSTYGIVFKPYPSCGYTHRIVDCALAARVRYGFAPDDIAAIDIHLPDFHAAILPFMMPKDQREARFSLPFCAALALTRGAVTMQDFADEAWTHPDMIWLIERTTVRPFKPENPLMNYDPAEPDRLVITRLDGTIIEETIAYPLGAPQRPMSHKRIVEKFVQNAGTRATDTEAAEKLERLARWIEAPSLTSVFKDWIV